MKKILLIVPRWIPALIIMSVIFYFSSQPGENLPNFLSWDRIVKKGGHMAGYGTLALCYLYALKEYNHPHKLAWLLAVLYAATDEFHQSYTTGRNATALDVLLFDNLGAALALWVHYHISSTKERMP